MINNHQMIKFFSYKRIPLICQSCSLGYLYFGKVRRLHILGMFMFRWPDQETYSALRSGFESKSELHFSRKKLHLPPLMFKVSISIGIGPSVQH